MNQQKLILQIEIVQIHQAFLDHIQICKFLFVFILSFIYFHAKLNSSYLFQERFFATMFKLQKKFSRCTIIKFVQRKHQKKVIVANFLCFNILTSKDFSFRIDIFSFRILFLWPKILNGSLKKTMEICRKFIIIFIINQFQVYLFNLFFLICPIYFRKKFSGNEPFDSKTMTMQDLITWNPKSEEVQSIFFLISHY